MLTRESHVIDLFRISFPVNQYSTGASALFDYWEKEPLRTFVD